LRWKNRPLIIKYCTVYMKAYFKILSVCTNNCSLSEQSFTRCQCPTLLGSSILSSASTSHSCRGFLTRWPLSSVSTSCPSSDARFEPVKTTRTRQLHHNQWQSLSIPTAIQTGKWYTVSLSLIHLHYEMCTTLTVSHGLYR